jgi:hypothetical protein
MVAIRYNRIIRSLDAYRARSIKRHRIRAIIRYRVIYDVESAEPRCLVTVVYEVRLNVERFESVPISVLDCIVYIVLIHIWNRLHSLCKVPFLRDVIVGHFLILVGC